MLSTGEEKGVYQSMIKPNTEVWEQRDPESMAINGFSWEQLQKGKDLQVVGNEVVDVLSQLGVKRKKAV